MLIAESLLLLATDDATGKTTVARTYLDLALGGAILTDLAVCGCVVVDGEGRKARVTVTQQQPGNDPTLAVAIRRLAEAGRSLVPPRESLFGGALRHPTLLVGLDVPKPELDRRIAERTRRMFDAGVEEEVREALAAEPSTTASKIIGLQEVATLPREEASEALIVRTRRYAAYQRKWLRRLEGLVIVAADRPPEETAAEIVTLARTRERLPRP